MLQRLDRLTQDEDRMTVAQTLGMVHGLVNNMRIVIDSALFLLDWTTKTFLRAGPVRCQGIDRRYSASSR